MFCESFKSFDSEDNLQHVFSRHSFPQDFNVLENLEKLEKLRYLKLDPGHCSVLSRMLRQNSLKEDILRGGNLENLSLNGFLFLPIDYEHWQNLNHLDVVCESKRFFPELLNLSILFQRQNRDTTQGNWHFMLKNLVDEENSIINVLNGPVKTFYKNGERLSEGKMINGKPDGTWTFWYPNGKLCEERHYLNGERTGEWIFRNPSKHWVDTALIINYENGELIARKDFDYGYVHPYCYRSEDHHYEEQVNEMRINYSSTDSTNISLRRTWGLHEVNEIYIANSKSWSWKIVEKCDGNIIDETTFRGKPNQLSYYYETKHLDWDRGKISQQYISSVDLLSCEAYLILRTRNWQKDALEVEKEVKSIISPEYWQCDRMK